MSHKRDARLKWVNKGLVSHYLWDPQFQTKNPGSLTNSEDLDDLQHRTTLNTSGYVLFSKTKPIFRERNAIFLEILTTSQYITWTTEADPGFLDIEFKFTKGGLMH